MNQGANRVLVVAPHPDDETLGCGGTLQRLLEGRATLHWLILTKMSQEAGYSDAEISAREREISVVAKRFGFASVTRLDYAAATLTEVPRRHLIQDLAKVFDEVQPTCLYLPYPHDAHSDHRVCFETGAACSKWFRRPNLQRVFCYEVPSETGFNIHPSAAAFRPTTYVRLTEEQIENKISIMLEYKSECGSFPFPRSAEGITALARYRGSECGATMAEGFLLLREQL